MTDNAPTDNAQARRSTVNASELCATFTDYDERSAPYEGRALRMRLTSDVLFVYIGKLTEEVGTERFEFEDKNGVGVDAEALYEALGSMLRRGDRHNIERLGEGTLPADHPSRITVEKGAVLPGVRRRA